MQVERNTQMKRDELNAPVRVGSGRASRGCAGAARDRSEPGGQGQLCAARSRLTEALWFVVEACVINNKLVPFSALRVALLRLFGAKIGPGCRFVHPLRVKAPWNLEVGANCWFGVDAWIYNQAPIRIGSNVCISQGAFLTPGRTITHHDGSARRADRDRRRRLDHVEVCGADGRDDRPFGAW